MRKKIAAAIAAALAVGVGAGMLLAGSAGAALTSRAGTFTERQVFVRATSAFSTSSTSYVDVPGASVSVTVPSNVTRLVDARFTAESACSGERGWCTVRVVLVDSSGVVTELQPSSGFDYAFDSATSSTDLWEGHALERTSYRQAPGTYRLLVQAAVVAGASSLRLDDYHLAVEVVR